MTSVNRQTMHALNLMGKVLEVTFCFLIKQRYTYLYNTLSIILFMVLFMNDIFTNHKATMHENYKIETTVCKIKFQD